MLEFRKITVLLFVFMLASTGLVFVTDCASAGIGGSMTGTISSDDTVTSPLSVPVSGILDISAGVTLRFQGDYDFKVLGTLRCLGTALNPVRISFDSATQGPGKWKGIIVDGGSAVFNYTIIQSASTAIHIKSTTGVEINYCHLGKSTYGIRGESSAGFSMYNTTIQDCTDRDIFLSGSSDGNMELSILKQTGSGTTLPAIELGGQSTLNALNCTIYNKYKHNAELNGNSQAKFTNCNQTYKVTDYRLVDVGSLVTINNFLHVYGGTKTLAGIDHFVNAIIKVFDSTNLIHNKIADINGEVRWLEVTYMEISSTGILIHNISIEISWKELFEGKRFNVNMSTTDWERFLNDRPQFFFEEPYYIPEDTRDNEFLDLWDVVKDDYYSGEDLTINLVENTGSDVGGKIIADVDIRNNRWLDIDVLTGTENDNWTGPFYIKINASDPLGSLSGYSNESEYVQINVTAVNDPPRWDDIGVIEIIEDINYIDDFDARDHIADSDSEDFELSFATKDFDIANFAISIPAGQFQIKILHKNHTETTNLTLCAFDGQDWGNYSTKVVIVEQNDPPAINNSLDDFSMDEETIDSTSVKLYDVFTDSDNTTLKFKTVGSEHFNISIVQATGSVTFAPLENWYGKETIFFYVNDSEFEISDSLEITVNNINDPPEAPVIESPSDNFEFKVNETIQFTAHAYDPDIDNPALAEDVTEDQLSYSWYVNTSGIRLNIIDNFTYYSLPEGTHLITVIVTDSLGESNQTSFEIVIFGEFNLPTVTHISPLPDYRSITDNIRLEWEVDVELDALPLVSYIILMDEENPPKTKVTEDIKYTSLTVTLPRERTTYYWTVKPFLGTDEGIDESGVWFFYYGGPPPIYDHSAVSEPETISMYPGNSTTLFITVKNIGDMPDRYEVIINVEDFISDFFSWHYYIVNGSGDGTFGMSSTETETIQLIIIIQDDFDIGGDYNITIEVNSLSKANEQPVYVTLTIFDKPEPPPEPPKVVGSGLWKFILILFVIIILLVVVLVLFLYFRSRSEDEIEEGDEDDEDLIVPAVEPEELGAMPIPKPLPIPEPASVITPSKPDEQEPLPENDDILKTIRCGECGAVIEVSSADRPLTIDCSDCSNTFTLK